MAMRVLLVGLFAANGSGLRVQGGLKESVGTEIAHAELIKSESLEAYATESMVQTESQQKDFANGTLSVSGCTQGNCNTAAQPQVRQKPKRRKQKVLKCGCRCYHESQPSRTLMKAICSTDSDDYCRCRWPGGAAIYSAACAVRGVHYNGRYVEDDPSCDGPAEVSYIYLD